MHELPIAVVDAFVTEQPFSGNPAGVVVTQEPLADGLMQSIAGQMNLSETAFLAPIEGGGDAGFRIRYFTPTVEVALCGHATLGSAHWLFEQGRVAGDTLRLITGAGVPLTIARQADSCLSMDLPPDPVTPATAPAGLVEAMGAPVWEAVRGETDWLLRFEDESVVRGLSPDLNALMDYPRLVIATASADAGTDADIVCRCFAMASGIPEDPVTGSAHRTLAAYWSPLWGPRFVSQQLSKRGGRLSVEVLPAEGATDLANDAEVIRISGRTVTRLHGELILH